MEHYKLIGDAKGQQIVDSKHFQDMRALLKLCTLETKKFVPGTRPYDLMNAIVGYSMVPPYSQQPITLTLPFIAPQLIHKYKKPEYEKGMFVQYKNRQIIPAIK
jgi:hypothetical protein